MLGEPIRTPTDMQYAIDTEFEATSGQFFERLSDEVIRELYQTVVHARAELAGVLKRYPEVAEPIEQRLDHMRVAVGLLRFEHYERQRAARRIAAKNAEGA